MTLMFTEGHNMDVVGEIKEEPFSVERISNEMNSKSEEFQSDLQFEAVNLSHLNNKTPKCSENNLHMSIKEEPYVERTSKELKLKSEESQVAKMNLQNKLAFETECLENNSQSSVDKVSTKIEIKEEPMWEDGTSTNKIPQQRGSSLDLDPIPQNNVKETASCITGIDVDFPSAESRSYAGAAYDDCDASSFRISSAIEKELCLKVPEVASDFKADSNICEKMANNKPCYENRLPQKSTYKTVILTNSTVNSCRCTMCKKKPNKMLGLKIHKLIDTGVKVYKCDICEKSFDRISRLKAHNLVHLELKAYKCKICEKSYKHISHLNRHIVIHSVIKQYQCDICGKGFSCKSNLKRHIFMHSGTKPNKCDICEKLFTRMEHLKVHILIHSGTKPHKCDVCQKRFSQISSLRTHQLIHLGTKPFRCIICGKSFNTRSSMNRHTYLHSGTKS